MKKNIFLFAILMLILSGCEKPPLPISNFSFSGDNKPAPCEVSFSNSSTDAESFQWEFGDGTNSTLENPKHNYTTEGTYTVKLTVVGEGGENSVTKDVKILAPIPDPTANFTYEVTNEFAPAIVEFTNGSSNAASYFWDFGDGSTSTDANPDHLYNSGGTYNVTLTAKNEINVENIINKTVTINNAPTKLKITSVILEKMPFTRSNGVSWDDSDGPDVFFSITDDDKIDDYTNDYFRSLVYSDLTSSELPLTYSNNFPVTISALDFKYAFVFRDFDKASSFLSEDDSELIGGYYFTARNSMPTNGDQYPETISFSSNDSELRFTLNVEWEL